MGRECIVDSNLRVRNFVQLTLLIKLLLVLSELWAWHTPAGTIFNILNQFWFKLETEYKSYIHIEHHLLETGCYTV